jgi:hypothetical protein
MKKIDSRQNPVVQVGAAQYQSVLRLIPKIDLLGLNSFLRTGTTLSAD